MKTYVFVSRRICEIGGAEQYLYNKTRYLERTGWRVFVFSGRRGRILINGFEKYKEDICPALSYAPECFSAREVRRTLDEIVRKVGDCGGDCCIVESDGVNRAVWGELIARRLGAKHLAFIMQENHGYREDVKRFLRFKYERHELAGITQQSVRQMLGDESAELRDDTKISAYCNNVVEDCEDKVSALLSPDADHIFGSLGRLEKPCVPAILDGFRTYFAAHPDERFQLVLIGGASSETREAQIREEMEAVGNVSLLITGNMYPLPVSFLNRIEVFVSTSGSSSATYRAHRPTVRVHPVTGEPVGVIGLDFDLNDKTMYDVTPGMNIPDCIDRALREADRIVFNADLGESYFQQMHAEFDRQLAIAERTEPGTYYDEKLLLRIRTAHIHKHFSHWLSGHLIGGGGHELLRAHKKRLKNR